MLPCCCLREWEPRARDGGKVPSFPRSLLLALAHRENCRMLAAGAGGTGADASSRGVLGKDSAWPAGAWDSTLGTQEVMGPPGEKAADTHLPRLFELRHLLSLGG